MIELNTQHSACTSTTGDLQYYLVAVEADAITYREQWECAEARYAALQEEYAVLEQRHKALVELCSRAVAQWQAIEVGDELPTGGGEKPACWTPLDETWDESPEWKRRDVEVAA